MEVIKIKFVVWVGMEIGRGGMQGCLSLFSVMNLKKDDKLR